MRILAVKLDFRDDWKLFDRLKELSWQAARYKNLFLRAKWAEAKNLKVDPKKDIPHDVTKWIRHDEKMDLSGGVYAAAEKEVNTTWGKFAKRILAGAPLPEYRVNGALEIRGHFNRNESSVRLSKDGERYLTHLQLLSEKLPDGTKRPEGTWLEIPVALGTAKDYQAELIDRMVTGEVPIKWANISIKPERHQVILRLVYPLPIQVSEFGKRKATLGPIGANKRLWLRTEYESRDFTGRLHTLLERKDSWEDTRRRVLCQIGRRKGSARRKRNLLANMTWDGWLSNWLHTWSREIIDWLKTQGIGDLTIVGLEAADWPAYRFTQMLKDKGDLVGMIVHTEADLADPATERAVKREIQRKRRKATKAAKAIQELDHQMA